MSMLSAQCDELRSMAESVGLAMPQAATLMMGAADTIDRLGAENAKLRSELESVGTASYLYGRSDLKAENAKLRELAGELWTYAEQELLCDENCPYGDTCDWMEPTVVCVFKRRMRELGVEVDV